MTISDLVKRIEDTTPKSAWKRGVKAYALEMLEQLQESADGGYYDENNANVEVLKKALLNGAESWRMYSYGGSALIYDADIAERLCTPSELKRTRYGERNPNRAETWLDVQARALAQAYYLIRRSFV